jgi:hypothetical protein
VQLRTGLRVRVSGGPPLQVRGQAGAGPAGAESPPRARSRSTQLAQVNVARLRAPLDDPSMREFVAALDRIDRSARASPGHVWRLATGDGHGYCVVTDGAGPAFVNVSVWADYASLHEFVYRSDHARYLRRRGRWFAPTPQPSTALWWVPTGTRPTLREAVARLEHLRMYGPSPRAFSLRRRFTAAGHPCPSRPVPTAAR